MNLNIIAIFLLKYKSRKVEIKKGDFFLSRISDFLVTVRSDNDILANPAPLRSIMIGYEYTVALPVHD